MSTSGTVSTTTFNTLKIVDHAFRRCKIAPQTVTAEMHEYAKDALYLVLSNLANPKPPSWCIEKYVLPLVEGNPEVALPTGVVAPLNVNIRSTTVVEPTEVNSGLSITSTLLEEATIVSVNITSDVALTVSVSSDGVTWSTVGSISANTDGFVDMSAPISGYYIKFDGTDTTSVTINSYHTNPSEIPMGPFNRDIYSAIPNKTSKGRPVNYWFNRDISPVLRVWPSPESSIAETHQLVVLAHRHIMDVGTLSQTLEVPQRWLDAIIYLLAVKLAEETPQVDPQVLVYLSQVSIGALNNAWDGDNDGSSSFIQPSIGCYTV